MENNYIVYMHIFPNNKVYIGITSQKIERRWRYNGSGYKTQIIYNAIQKYGWGNIEHKILYENLSREEAEQKEIELITQYKSNNSKYGYNIDNGGNHQGKMSEQTKVKLSKIFMGRTISEEAHKKMIENMHKTKVYQFDTNYNFINSYNSIREASRITKIDGSQIVNCCKKKKNFKTAGGFIWSYTKKINIDDYIDYRKKKVYQYDKNKKLINVWMSLEDAIKNTKIYHIQDCIKCRRKTAGGYIWVYE